MSLPIFPTNPKIDISKYACTTEFFSDDERNQIEELVNSLNFEDNVEVDLIILIIIKINKTSRIGKTVVDFCRTAREAKIKNKI